MTASAAQPEEIVKTALMSPHRGILIAAFSVGIYTSIFRRLSPLDSTPDDAVEKTWVIKTARFTKQLSWRHLLCKLISDVVVLSLTRPMLWQNWIVNSAVLIQWLRESPIMVRMWPLSSIIWVAVAVLLLRAMASDISFKHSTREIQYTWWEVLRLP
jgi:hypothetical protein